MLWECFTYCMRSFFFEGGTFPSCRHAKKFDGPWFKLSSVLLIWYPRCTAKPVAKIKHSSESESLCFIKRNPLFGALEVSGYLHPSGRDNYVVYLSLISAPGSKAIVMDCRSVVPMSLLVYYQFTRPCDQHDTKRQSAEVVTVLTRLLCD
jgi:hypothetical protein